MSQAMRAIGTNEPLMVEWTRYKATKEFENSRAHVVSLVHPLMRGNGFSSSDIVDGAMWAAFMAGFVAATRNAGDLHESIDPASDTERRNGSPGAGAMGAVLEYRDLIRKALP